MGNLIPDNIKLTIEYIYNGEFRRIDQSDDVLELKWSALGSRITLNITAKHTVIMQYAALCFPHYYGKTERIFVNGYQSWTDTKEFYPDETLNDINTRLPKRLIKNYAFDGYGDSTFRDYDKDVLHGYDISYADNLFVGSFNADNAYLSIDHHIKNNQIILQSGISGYTFAGDFTLFDLTFDRDEYLGAFRSAPPKKLLGYTSWYLYYQDINQEKILKNLGAIDNSYDVFQIDDGYETYVGDWLSVDSDKFPDGLEPIVEKIHTKGLMAGIWLAPLIAEESSQVYKEHPEWFLTTKAGCNWSGFYGIDIYNPEAEAYVRKSLHHYVEMGFDFFKLDFLYAVNLQNRPDKTRAQISKYAYDIICEELDGKIILGCGAILSSAAGRFDYMRVGPDVSLRFDDVIYMRPMHRERISTKVTLQNTIYRSFLDGALFGNDPDVFLLRSNDIRLSKEQREALVTINALFGSMMMTSDNIGEYDYEQKATLAQALKLRDATDKEYRRYGNYIYISYKLDGKYQLLRYDTENGVFTTNITNSFAGRKSFQARIKSTHKRNAMDRSSKIFNNEMPAKVVRKAVRAKNKFLRKYGDDTETKYPLSLEPIPGFEWMGLQNIVFGSDNSIESVEKPLVVGNIRMGFGHYRIALAMASCAKAMGFTPLWLDLASFDATGSKVIRYQNDMYSLASRISQKSFLFNKIVWEPLNSEGFKKITYNVGDQKNSELLVPIYGGIPKDTPFIGTHVWPSQGAVHAGMTNVVNAIPDNWPMGLHLSEGSIHTIQTHFAYLGYKTLYGFDKKPLNGMSESELKVVGHYVDHELLCNLESDNAKRAARIKAGEPYRILLTAGGAGAGADTFVKMIEHLLPRVTDGSVALFINFGDHKDMYEHVSKKLPEFAELSTHYFNEYGELQKLTQRMDDEVISGIHCIYNEDIFQAVYSTNLLMPKCELMVTKPSELAYYPIPKIMIRHIGGHEVYGAIHSAELGDGTFECYKDKEILGMLDTFLRDKDITLHMLDRILELKEQGYYDGGYNCVKLAAGIE